ncbi:MAG: hypothetical protein IPK07_00705 [Deltaproteobacteria bacterium]|nr:hypothetical protein [Deltaproteobacteria bacterium]
MAIPVRVALLIVALVALAWDARRPRAGPRAGLLLVSALAVGEIAFVLALWSRHRGFPLYLEIMEGAVVQHVERLLAGAPLYAEPSPDFVPFAYNPLYYVLCAPLVRAFGAHVAVLRGFSIVGAVAASVLVFEVVARRSGSRWRALVAVGLFAAAYEAMDAYLDTAHGDTWLLVAILTGTALVEAGVGEARGAGPVSRRSARVLRVLGVAVLCAGFWIKQHGALFVLGALSYVWLRMGPRRSIAELAVAALAGPIAYGWLGPRVFGPWLHFYTWTVPRSWSSLELTTFTRLFAYLARYVPLLALAAAAGWVETMRRAHARLDLWQTQGLVALGAGAMGALDAGGNDNVFIPLATFAIVVGVSELPRLELLPERWRRHAEPLVLAASFAALLYDPRHVWTSMRAEDAYADLTALVADLPGPVFAPDLGPTDGVTRFQPPLTWVAIEDLVRGPRGPALDPARVRALLTPVAEPPGPAFILASRPLERRTSLAPLLDRYRLVADFGQRFVALRTQPMRCGRLYPRYLYRWEGASAPAPRNHS